MKILLLTGQFYPKISGGAFTDWNFSKIAATKGHDVHVFTPKEGGLPSIETVENVHIHRPYRASREGHHPNSKFGQIHRIIFVLRLTFLLLFNNSYNFDVIYSTGHMFHPIAKVIGKIKGVPVINFIGYSPSIEKDRLPKIDLRMIFERMNFRLFMGTIVLTRTPQIRDLLKETYDVSARIAHGILDEESIQEFTELDRTLYNKMGIDKNKKLLLYVGRFVDIKNPSAPVEVLAGLPDDYRLVMVGDGKERKRVEASIKQHDVEAQVHLLGEIPHEQALDTIAIADALVITSDVEAYPTVLFEALSLKTPVVSTPVGIVPELTHRRLTKSSIKDMAATIQRIELDSRPEVDQETLEKYSINRYTDETIKVIRSVVQDRNERSCLEV